MINSTHSCCWIAKRKNVFITSWKFSIFQTKLHRNGRKFFKAVLRRTNNRSWFKIFGWKTEFCTKVSYSSKNTSETWFASFCRIFWTLMIVLSIFCTLWLIASLIDQISKNPIVIYREDTPIDVTKVEIFMTNLLRQI